MSIGLKRSIPESKSSYHSKWTGREVDKLLDRIAENYDSAHVVLPSTEANPFNIDTLFDVGNFSIEYITPSVLPVELVLNPVRPFEVQSLVDDGVLHQAIHTLSSTYIRTYDVPHRCDCHCDTGIEPGTGTWSEWHKNVIEVPVDVVCSVRDPGQAPLQHPTQQIDAEYIILHRKDGSELDLQAWFNGDSGDENAGGENANTITIKSEDITISHRGLSFKLADIMDKLLAL